MKYRAVREACLMPGFSGEAESQASRGDGPNDAHVVGLIRPGSTRRNFL